MILAACRFGGIDPGQTFFIGDRDSDMKAAENAGCPGILIRRRGEDGEGQDMSNPYNPVFTTLLDAVLSIYAESI